MELKSYQTRTIQELKEFIGFTKTAKTISQAYEEYWISKNVKPAKNALACSEIMKIMGSKFPIDDKELRCLFKSPFMKKKVK